MTAYLEQEATAGFSIETRSATQAVIVRNSRRWRQLRAGLTERLVLSVDEDGHVTTCAAEPVRW